MNKDELDRIKDELNAHPYAEAHEFTLRRDKCFRIIAALESAWEQLLWSCPTCRWEGLPADHNGFKPGAFCPDCLNENIVAVNSHKRLLELQSEVEREKNFAYRLMFISERCGSIATNEGSLADWPENEHAAAMQAVQRLRDDRDKWKEQSFRPLGDNHHNAAICPHCSPNGKTLESENAALQQRIGELESERGAAVSQRERWFSEWERQKKNAEFAANRTIELDEQLATDRSRATTLANLLQRCEEWMLIVPPDPADKPLHDAWSADRDQILADVVAAFAESRAAG